MKYFFITIPLLGLFFSNCYCQNSNDATILKNKNVLQVENLVIDENTIFHNTSEIEISDSLLVFGTLINDGTIRTKNCIVTNGTIKAYAYDSLIVKENLTFKNATTTSNDTIHIVTFSAKNIIIDGYTKIESAYLTTQKLIINDTLEFTGKLGVKKITSDFILNGIFRNNANENIQLYGNLINNNKQTCTKANFELFGENKSIHGNFSCYRLDLEKATTTYTNYDSLTITDVFSGKGTIVQEQNAYLSINTQTSPPINATADGNSLEYTRGGKQILNTTECYNLILSKQGGAGLFLSQNCVINNSLVLNKKSMLDCGNFAVKFPNTHSKSIVSTSFNGTQGIYLRNGKLIFDEFKNNETLQIPLMTTDTSFAGISITNLDENHSTFTIDSLFNYVTETGQSVSDSISEDFVNTTWHFSTDIQKAECSFYWDKNKEQDYFDSENSSIYQSNGFAWKELETQQNTKWNTSLISNPNEYFTIGNEMLLLPIDLKYFTIHQEENYVLLKWELNSSKQVTIEKSYDGTLFHPIGTTEQKEFVDFSILSNQPVYYRLKTDEKNYSVIKSICIDSKNEILISSKNIQYIGNEQIIKLSIYNLNGKEIRSTTKTILQINNLPHGTYFLKIRTKTKEIQRIIYF